LKDSGSETARSSVQYLISLLQKAMK